MEASRIGGALIIGSIGWSMVTGKKSSNVQAEANGAMVVPLACPMMAGPGAIATVIAIGSTDKGSVRFADLLIILALSIVLGVLPHAAEPVEKLFGEKD